MIVLDATNQEMKCVLLVNKSKYSRVLDEMTQISYKFNQGSELEFSFGHVAALKLLRRVCNPFGSQKSRD